jgi:transcriptional regulator with XRE-family HTH domain
MTSSSQQTLGEVLREHRKAKGLSLRKAAALADLDQAVLSRIENGHRLPNAAQLGVLASVYSQPVEPLMAINAYCDIKQKYGDTGYYADCLQLLNEDAATYKSGKNEARRRCE